MKSRDHTGPEPGRKARNAFGFRQGWRFNP
jgi:hypothetical protein